MYRIVVGVDGSKESRRALEWALEEAGLRQGAVHLVSSYEVPIPVASYRLGGTTSLEELAEYAREEAERRLGEVIEGVSPSTVPVTHEVVAAAQPARALIDRAVDADLLVVGSRGHGGFTGLLLGSVSQQCVHHAPCPVVVVR